MVFSRCRYLHLLRLLQWPLSGWIFGWNVINMASLEIMRYCGISYSHVYISSTYISNRLSRIQVRTDGGGGGGTGVPWYLIFDFLGGVISDNWFFWGLISDFLKSYIWFLRTCDIWFFGGYDIWYLIFRGSNIWYMITFHPPPPPTDACHYIILWSVTNLASAMLYCNQSLVKIYFYSYVSFSVFLGNVPYMDR